MNLYRNFAVLLLAVFVCANCYGQNTKNVQSKILGKWIMTKHLLNNKNMWTPEFKSTYEFKKDGTWSSTFWRKGYGTTVTVGQWKMADNGTAIQLYKNRFLPPNNKYGTVGDHNLAIIELTDSTFVTNEYMFSEDPIGTSYYKKN